MIRLVGRIASTCPDRSTERKDRIIEVRFLRTRIEHSGLKSLEGSRPRRYRGHAICLYGPKVGVGLASQCRRNDDTTRTTTATKTDPTRERGTPVLLTRRNRATRVSPLARRRLPGRDSPRELLFLWTNY